MESVVRSATVGDLPAIVEIYNHYVLSTAISFELEPVRPEERMEWFHEHPDHGPHRLLVATAPDARELVGWASSSTFRPRAAYATTVEVSVYCRPEATRHGVGTALYTRLFAEIASEDVERIVAGVTLPNPASEALHRKFGFRRVGVLTRVGRKFGRYWDVAWYERPNREASASEPAGGIWQRGCGAAP